jgi:hypothetical protein
MPIAFVIEIPGVTKEENDRVGRKVSESGSPAGCVFHADGPFDGGIRQIEVWESQEAAQAFYGSDLMREATSVLPEEKRHVQPKILMTWPVHGIDDGTGWRPAN